MPQEHTRRAAPARLVRLVCARVGISLFSLRGCQRWAGVVIEGQGASINGNSGKGAERQQGRDGEGETEAALSRSDRAGLTGGSSAGVTAPAPVDAGNASAQRRA